MQSNSQGLPKEFQDEARKIMLALVTTTVHDDYFMFIKMGFKMPVSPTDRDAVSKAELELRRRQAKAIELFRKYVPGCEKAFIARTSPTLNIRRARVIACDYDITATDVLEGRHFEDDVMAYGFHDNAPRFSRRRGRLGPECFPYAGVALLRQRQDCGDLYLAFDAGPYGRSHQHEDRLGLWLFAYGRNLLASRDVIFTTTPRAPITVI